MTRPAFGRLAVLTLIVSACAIPQAEVTPEGTLEVFSRASLTPGPRLPNDWVIESDADSDATRDQINVASNGENATLGLSTGPHRFVLARRTKAALLATPYIGWSWRFAAPPGRESDIRIIVGFHGGNPKSRSWGGEPLVHLGSSLPPFDRAIAILWGRSALERGSFATQSTIPEYIARGGHEHEDAWWSDNIDLSALYRRAWPSDRIERTRIMFVGFAVAEGSGEANASFGDIVLYR